MGSNFFELLHAKRRVKELEAEVARLKELEIQVTQLEAEIARLKAIEAEFVQLKKQLCPPEAPTIKGTISPQELWNLYAQIFPQDMDKFFISDINYDITAISEIKRFIAWDNTNNFPYIAERKDCDDFALALAGSFAKYPGWAGFPINFIWSDFYGGHAFITCVAWKSFEERTPTVYFFEPQNDQEIAIEKIAGKKLWLLPMKQITNRR